MHRTIFAKRIPFIALTLCAFASSPLWAEESSQAAFTLGAFSYDFARLGSDEASQIRELKSIGYGGMVMNLSANTPNKAKAALQALRRYQAAIGDTPFKCLNN